jgi:hypothetical protein
MYVSQDFIDICKKQCEKTYLDKAIQYIPAKVNHTLNGSPVVPDEVFKERISICQTCPNFDPDKRQCKLCGCPMDAKAKWADVDCPDTPPKWVAYELQSKSKNRGCCS